MTPSPPRFPLPIAAAAQRWFTDAPPLAEPLPKRATPATRLTGPVPSMTPSPPPFPLPALLHSVGQDERRTPCPTKRSSHWSRASACCCGSAMMILDPMQTLRMIICNFWNFAGSTCGGKAWSGIDRCHVMTWRARYESVACRTVASHSAVQFVSSLLVALRLFF